MSSRGYKPGELLRQTMLARVTNPSQNDTECQQDSQGNSLGAGVEQGSDDVELTAESLNEKKSGQSSRLFGEKGEEMGMNARSR